MRYVLYARKSSESEDRQVQSIEDQARILRQLAADRSLHVVEEITESKSAKDPGVRPGFDRLLKLVEQGRADAILCWHINRLTRNPIDSGRLSWLLQRGTLQVIQTPERQFLPTDNVLVFSVETGTANQFILDLKKSVRRGMESKVAKGWSPHRAPEGYVNNLRDHTIEADHEGERFTLLRQAWQLVLSGSHTPAQAIRVLNDEWGYRTRKTEKGGGSPLSRSAGYHLFSSVFYTGYFRHGGEIHRGNHPPMVTQAEFERVQRLLRGQVGKPHPREQHVFPFTGLLRCARCGGAISAEKQPGRHGRGNFVYYHCSDRLGLCGKRSVREDVLERQIDYCLAGVRITGEFGVVIREALSRWVGEEFGAQEARYGAQARELVASERMLSVLVELRLKGLIDDDVFAAKQAQLKASVSGLRLAVAETQERLDHTRAVIGRAVDFLQTAPLLFLTGGWERKREVARSLGARYLFDPETTAVLIEVNPLLQYLQAGRVTDSTPNPGVLEPLEVGSGKAKETLENSKVSAGWPAGTLSENLFGVFRAVLSGELDFAPLPHTVTANVPEV
jgi:site-specific DNA recombinase